MDRLKILHLATSDLTGGAARASYRIHKGLLGSGIDSKLLVLDRISGDKEVKIAKSIALKPNKLRAHLGYSVMKLLITDNQDLHSPAVFPSGMITAINQSSADIVNLHWIQGEYISVEDIGRISKPLVWTLHDMWAFCGAEHYSLDTRYINGYTRESRSCNERGVDLNRWVWQRKLKNWKKPINIICPSSWMEKAAMSSKLMKNWPIRKIAYPLDENIYIPISVQEARTRLGIEIYKRVILFGAIGIDKDKRKGFDLFVDAINKLDAFLENEPDIIIATFGSADLRIDLPYPVHNFGYITNELDLRLIYCAADVVVVPSRSDNLPQIAIESQMSGTPVVAFDIGGLADIVSHLKTGYLAKAYDTEELAYGMTWASRQPDDRVRRSARELSVQKYSPSVISNQYKQTYMRILEINPK